MTVYDVIKVFTERFMTLSCHKQVYDCHKSNPAENAWISVYMEANKSYSATSHTHAPLPCTGIWNLGSIFNTEFSNRTRTNNVIHNERLIP